MTDYAKWDAIVASLSSSDDSDSSTDEAEEASASGSLEASRSPLRYSQVANDTAYGNLLVGLSYAVSADLWKSPGEK